MYPFYSEARSYFFFNGTPMGKADTAAPLPLHMALPSLACRFPEASWTLHWTQCIYQPMGGLSLEGPCAKAALQLGNIYRSRYLQAFLPKEARMSPKAGVVPYTPTIPELEAKAGSQVPVSYCGDTQTIAPKPNQPCWALSSSPHTPQSPNLRKQTPEEADSKAELWFTYSANQLFLWANPGPPCPEGLP